MCCLVDLLVVGIHILEGDLIYISVMEIISKEWRNFCSVTIQIAFTLGYMLVQGYSYTIRDYVKVQLLSAVPPLVFFIAYL